MNKDQPEYRPLNFDDVARYLSNEMSPAEGRAFEQQLAESEALQKEFEHIQKTWDAAVVTPEIDTASAWKKLDARVQSVSNDEKIRSIHRSDQVASKSGNQRWILRIAASIVLLAAVAIGWQFRGSPETIAYATTQPGSFELPDGSVAQLNASSEITFLEGFDSDERKVSLKGEAFFKVTHNPQKPFVVETGMGSITVLGTEFNVNAVSDTLMEVVCQSGKVRVEGAKGEGAAVLTAGESAFLSTSSGGLIEEKNTGGLYWLNKTLVFKNADLKTVFKTLSRAFNVKIKVKTKSIHNCRQTATFDDMNIDAILGLIKETHGLTLTKKGAEYEVDGQGC